MEIHRTKILIFFFLLAFLGRTVFHLGPNIELITLVMLLTATYMGRKTSFWLTLSILLASDLILGNTNIFLFTWTGFLLPILFAGKKGILQNTATGIGANLFFYAWTNFGVWLLDSWGMYSRNLDGLLASYINGLPFLKNQLLSTLVFIPLGFTIWEIALQLKHDRLHAKHRELNFSQQ